ncbi:MAG: hypothetical protein QG657_2652, partial [Acidobacteriota bacterium]|nr:hypothetical protein [Acidobacteriota bacterium]
GNLNNIGVEYFNLSQNQKSLEYYEKALCISREVGDRSGEAFILNNILGVYSNFDLYHKSLAIFYGKQAVNTIQNLRQDNENLNSIAKQKYLQSKEDIYRNTASFTIDSGRISEAQQVLDILKLDEYDSYIRRDRSAYTPQYSPIDYTGFEQKWIDWQKVVMEKLSSISKPYHELLIKSNKVPEEAKKLEALKVDLEKSQKEYSDFLALMKAEFEKHEKEKDPDIEALSKKSSVLKELLLAIDRESNGKNVALHFLIFKGQISVIITTPTLQTVKQSATFDEKEFNRVIYDYREVIAKLKGFPRGLRLLPSTGGQIEKLIMQKKDIETKLYNLIFLPAAQYLKQYGAINLLVSLDGVLRYIPLSSLYDGEHYLIQKYRFVLLTPSSLKHIDKKFINEMKILGMGAGKGGNGFAPLPFVNREIRAIVNDTKKGCLGIIKGHALIDDEFSRRAMVRRLKTTGYPFVHIASHFNFSP